MSVPSSDSAGIRQIIRGLRAAGYALDSVDDGDFNIGPGADDDGNLIVTNEHDAIDAITAVDDARLYVKSASGDWGWVRFVMGNEPDEVVCDHTVNLSDAINPITDRWYE